MLNLARKSHSLKACMLKKEVGTPLIAMGLQNQERTSSVEANSPNPDPSTRRNLVSSQEGRNIKCVVKRVRVDFDKDINDASEALQEAKSLIRLDVHPHVVTYMDTWLHR